MVLQKVEIGQDGLLSFGGETAVEVEEKVKKFVQEAGQNAFAFFKSGILILYFDKSTGNVLIRDKYNSTAIGYFLLFISRDPHAELV